MPKSEHVSEQDLDLYLTGRLPKGKDSALDTHLGECKPSVVKLSATVTLGTACPRLKASTSASNFTTPSRQLIRDGK